MKLDLRTRCARCRKIPRGKNQKANWERYSPFCSYACQEWFKLEEARKDLNAKRLLAAAKAQSEEAQRRAAPTKRGG